MLPYIHFIFQREVKNKSIISRKKSGKKNIIKTDIIECVIKSLICFRKNLKIGKFILIFTFQKLEIKLDKYNSDSSDEGQSKTLIHSKKNRNKINNVY